MTNEKHFLTSANPVTLLLLLWAWCDYTYFDSLYLGNFSGPLRQILYLRKIIRLDGMLEYWDPVKLLISMIWNACGTALWMSCFSLWCSPYLLFILLVLRGVCRKVFIFFLPLLWLVWVESSTWMQRHIQSLECIYSCRNFRDRNLKCLYKVLGT